MTIIPTIQYVEEISRLAGKIILEGFNKVKTVDTKSSAADLVTEFDVSVEKFLKEKIHSDFPSHVFLAEESSDDNAKLTNSPTWIIDPIDGTTNFIHTFPVCCVSIAFADQGDVLLGVVYNPVTDELWSGSRGNGSHYSVRSNPPERLKTSGRQSIGEALIATGFSVGIFRMSHEIQELPEVKKLHFATHRNFQVLSSESRDIRRTGSAATDLCFVAMGRTDSYFEFGVREWDVAAGLVILKEAGGAVSSVGGSSLDLNARNFLCASSEGLRLELCQKLVDVDMRSVVQAIDDFKNMRK